MSDFDVLFVSDALVLFVSVFVSEAEDPLLSLFGLVRLSVLYQPEPLNTIAGAVKSFRGGFPQFGHAATGASVNDWTAENAWPQASQR